MQIQRLIDVFWFTSPLALKTSRLTKKISLHTAYTYSELDTSWQTGPSVVADLYRTNTEFTQQQAD